MSIRAFCSGDMGWWLPLPSDTSGCPARALILSALGSPLLTHRAEEESGVCHHGQEVFEVHTTISCGGQKNTEWAGAFQSRLGHCNPGMAISIYLLDLIIKVTHSGCRKFGTHRKVEGKKLKSAGSEAPRRF